MAASLKMVTIINFTYIRINPGSIRLALGKLAIAGTHKDRTFPVAGPRLWNSLPSNQYDSLTLIFNSSAGR